MIQHDKMSSPENRCPYIAISGTIGVGKSTSSVLIAKELGFYPLMENPHNPYLDRFYDDPHRWAFNSQMFCLTAKYEKTQLAENLLSQNEPPLLDVPIQQDVHSYARAQHELKHMSDDEWRLYLAAYKPLKEKIRNPDLIVCLLASMSVILKRIDDRDRACERKIPPSYVELLDRLNRDWWANNNDNIPIVYIETDGLDITQSRRAQLNLLDTVSKALDNLWQKPSNEI